MAEENNAEDPAKRSGEFIRAGEAPAPAPVRTGTIGWLLSRLSRFPFYNRKYVRSLKTAQEVLEARKELGKTYIEHEEIIGQVHDLPITVGKQRFKRLREYFEEERLLTTEVNDAVVEGKTREAKNKLKHGEVEIQEMEQEKRKLRVRKELEELQNPPPPPPGPGGAQSEKMKRREDAHKRYESAIKRIDKMKVSAKAKTDLTKSAAVELEEEMEKIEKMP
jgi:hypothetical protein